MEGHLTRNTKITALLLSIPVVS